MVASVALPRLEHGCSEVISLTDVLKSVYLPNQPVFGSRFPNLGQAETFDSFALALTQGKDVVGGYMHMFMELRNYTLGASVYQP